MSKIYNEYVYLKNQNTKKMYLFEAGNFYIFLGNDAIKASSKLNLKISKFGNLTLKCGFPIKSLEKYLLLFQERNLDVLIIPNKEKKSANEKIIKALYEIDIYNITALEAMNFLC